MRGTESEYTQKVRETEKRQQQQVKMRTIQNEMTKKETKAKTCTSLAGKKT